MKNMKITRDPEVCFGKYVIQGTRIIVSELLENLPEYESWSELISEYPSLSEYTEEDLYNALVYILGRRYERNIFMCVYSRRADSCKRLVYKLRKLERRKTRQELSKLLLMLLRSVEPEENSMEYKWLRRYRGFLRIKTGREIKRLKRKLAELILLDLLSLIEPSDDRYKSALRI